MKSILAKLQWPDIPLPVAAVLAATVVLLPTSQLAVLGLLRATQKSSVESLSQAPPSAVQTLADSGPATGEMARPEVLPTNDTLHVDPLLAMTSAVNRERRAGERFIDTATQRQPLSATDPAPAITRYQGPDAAFSAALSSVFAPTFGRGELVVPPGVEGDTEPFAIKFVGLPLPPASTLTPAFALQPGAVNGDAWAQIHPDLGDDPSVSALQVTLTRALGR